MSYNLPTSIPKLASDLQASGLNLSSPLITSPRVRLAGGHAGFCAKRSGDYQNLNLEQAAALKLSCTCQRQTVSRWLSNQPHGTKILLSVHRNLVAAEKLLKAPGANVNLEKVDAYKDIFKSFIVGAPRTIAGGDAAYSAAVKQAVARCERANLDLQDLLGGNQVQAQVLEKARSEAVPRWHNGPLDLNETPTMLGIATQHASSSTVYNQAAVYAAAFTIETDSSGTRTVIVAPKFLVDLLYRAAYYRSGTHSVPSVMFSISVQDASPDLILRAAQLWVSSSKILSLEDTFLLAEAVAV